MVNDCNSCCLSGLCTNAFQNSSNAVCCGTVSGTNWCCPGFAPYCTANAATTYSCYTQSITSVTNYIVIIGYICGAIGLVIFCCLLNYFRKRFLNRVSPDAGDEYRAPEYGGYEEFRTSHPGAGFQDYLEYKNAQSQARRAAASASGLSSTWICPACTFKNGSDAPQSCKMCECIRPDWDRIEHAAAAARPDPALGKRADAVFYADRAKKYFEAKNYQGAMADATNALRFDPSCTEAAICAARCQLSMGDFGRAEHFLDGPSFSDDRVARFELERIQSLSTRLGACEAVLQEGKSPELVAQQLSQMVKSDLFRDLKAQSMLVEAYLASGKYIQADEASRDVFYIFPTHPEAMRLRGLTMYYIGNTRSAFESLQNALKKDPSNEKCQLSLRSIQSLENARTRGNDAFRAGRLDDALKAFTQAIDSSAVQGEILQSMLISRSEVLQNMKRFDDAIEDCTRVISLNNDNVKAYLRRAALFEKKNDNESAARDYEQAKRIDPENPEIRAKFRKSQTNHFMADKKAPASGGYYKILGIEPGADEKEIKKAYRAMALKYHPDKNAETEETRIAAEKIFKEVGEAYAVLSDPEKRKKYDDGDL